MSNEDLKFGATDHWTVLRGGGYQGGGLAISTFPTGVYGHSGQVRLAVGPASEPRVLLPLADQEAPVDLHGGSALSIELSSFSFRGRSIRFLDLICRSPELEGVFGDVVDSMLARIMHGESCLEAARSTIQDFRALLIRERTFHVDQRRVAGLVAELLVLNRLLDHSAMAWGAWRGPLGDRHDFRAGDTSLEVKAALRPNKSTLTINSLDQLEVPSGGTLHLLRLVLEPVSSGNLSISGLARSAIGKSDDPERLGTLLAAVGCSDIDDEKWNSYTFRAESEQLYEVREGFPRVTLPMFASGALPQGVYGVTYEIDLSVAQRFLCDAAVYDDMEGRLCS